MACPYTIAAGRNDEKGECVCTPPTWRPAPPAHLQRLGGLALDLPQLQFLVLPPLVL